MSSRFIVVGSGSMGRRRIGHALELTGGTVGVYDLRDDRMDEVSELFAVTRLSGIAEFQDFAPDGIFICVPPSDHEIYMDWALEHGVHFMVEQPISDRPENLAAIRKRALGKGLITHVSNNHRFSSEIQAMKAVMDSGELGRVMTAIIERGEWLPDWHPYEPYTDYYPSKKSLGGGLDSICDVSWLRYLFGDVRRSVSLESRRSDLDIDTDDVVQMVLDFEAGPQVILHTDMLQRKYAGEVKLVFEKGTLTHRAPDHFIRVYSVATDAWEERALADNRADLPSMKGKANFNFVEPMYVRDAAYFLDHLKRGDANTESLDDGIANLDLVYRLVRGS
ncbi:MAG: Gfo/Idh/MocA family oxidoreductase [Rhodospirillales bacterium]|nr:Gfo/Idh/MocA family oxidoreductase [Rhodospirillales bacterium]